MAQSDVIAQIASRLKPLDGLSPEALGEVVAQASLVRMTEGQMLCREGESDRFCIYLIKGSVETLSGGQPVKRIDAGTAAALQPLAERQPRTLSVRALTEVGLLRIPREVFETPPEERTLTGGISLSELDEDDDDSADDWMTMLLRAPLYSQLPVTNIHRIMSAMESVMLKRGDVIVRQGEPGDYFYFLSKGRARVFRQAREGEPPVMLAELAPGVSFGEEALVAGLPRNATVSMLTEGRVMRLAKPIFEELILEPTLERIAWIDAARLVSDGARWLDVRFPDEYGEDGLEGALNVPLGMLRMRMAKLDRRTRYIVYCDDGRRSAAGAFLMAGSGFDVQVLEGGITTPEGIDTIDTDQPVSADPTGGHVFGAVSSGPIKRAAAPPESAASSAPPAVEAPVNTVAITSQLRERLDKADRAREAAELRGAQAEAELRATQDALRSERERARELARELQHLRQTLTDMQRQAHDALMRERSAYERELTTAVENLEQALLEKEMVLEVERAKNQEEVARLRRLLEATGRTVDNRSAG